MAAWAAVLFAFSACQDIVEVEDLKAKDDIPSNGAPEITKIVLANDKELKSMALTLRTWCASKVKISVM